MKYLFVIMLRDPNEHKSRDFALFFNDKNNEISPEEKIKRVENIFVLVMKRYKIVKNIDICSINIISVMNETEIDYSITIDDIILRALTQSIFYDPYSGNYRLQFYEFGNLSILNLMKNKAFLHVFYLDKKNNLQNIYTKETVEKDFFYVYHTSDILINICTLTSAKDNISRIQELIEMIKQDQEIAFVIPDESQMSFIIDVLKLFMRYNNQVKLFMKVKNDLYNLSIDSSVITYKRVNICQV